MREAEEPDVLLQPMRDGAEVARDYNRTGLTLRDHPLAFLSVDLIERGMVTCRQTLEARDRSSLSVGRTGNGPPVRPKAWCS